MAAADHALDRERNRLLAKVARILDSLDQENPGASLRALSPQLVAALMDGRRAALDLVTGRASSQLAASIGVDLGGDLIDRSGWTGPAARKVYAARLLGAARAVEDKVAAGADPLEEAGWLRYWQMQIAGSEVHQVARDGQMQVARDVPALSRVMRVAEPGACDWCRTQASRGPVFHTEATALAVGHGNDRCHIVVVEDEQAIAAMRDAGAEAWQQSGLPAATNPYTRPGTRSADDPSMWLPGAQTPERLTAVRARLAGYDEAFANGRGSSWMREQEVVLRAELADLERALGVVRSGPIRASRFHPGGDVAARYPRTQTGIQPPFTPAERPPISRGSRNHILERHGVNGTGRTTFTWTDAEIMDAVDLVMADPDTVEHFGDSFVFTRQVDVETVRVTVRTDKPKPFVWTSYPKPRGRIET